MRERASHAVTAGGRLTVTAGLKAGGYTCGMIAAVTAGLKAGGYT